MASVCLFCCSCMKGDSGKCEGEQSCSVELLIKFLKVTQSHFGINILELIGSSAEGHPLYDQVCLKCEQSLQTICELFRELEGIRLKMEWELGELLRKMEVVGRTPSKVKWLRKNQPVSEFQQMANFRNNFISKCNRFLEESKPKLVLQPIEVLSGNIIVPDVISEDCNHDTTWNTSDNVDNDFVDFGDNDVNQILDQIEIKCSPASDEESKPMISAGISDSDNYNEDDDPITTKVKRSAYEKPFKCSRCPLAYTERKNLLRHQRTHHSRYFASIHHPKVQKPFKCPHCPMEFFHQTSLCRHQRTLHRNLYQSQRTKPLRSPTKTPKKKIGKHKPISQPIEEILPNISISDADDINQVEDQIEKKYSPPSEESDIQSEPSPTKKKPFKCSKCTSAYSLRRNLLRHQRTHHAAEHRHPQIEKHFKCPHCSIRFAHPNSIIRHQRISHQELYQSRRNQAKKAKSLKKKSKPVKGDQEKISKKPRKLVSCPMCHKSVQKYYLKSHLNLHLHHSTKDKDDPQSIHKCDHLNCPALFRTLFQLTRHKKLVHGENDEIPRKTCPICGKICTEHCNLKIHMKTQHDDENPDLPLPCDVDPHCPKRFPNESVLKWHQMYYFHNEWKRPLEIINCPECHKDFHGLGAFKKHQRKHEHPSGPWICEQCGVEFKSKGVLKTHGLFHTNPDNWAFQCEECGKKCATKYYLKEHMKVHSDLKLYACEACGNGYKSRHQLRKHINKFHAKDGFQDIPRKMAKPKFISRRIPSSKPPIKVD